MSKSKKNTIVPTAPSHEVVSITPGGGRPRRSVTTHTEALARGVVLPVTFILANDAHAITTGEG